MGVLKTVCRMMFNDNTGCFDKLLKLVQNVIISCSKFVCFFNQHDYEMQHLLSTVLGLS